MTRTKEIYPVIPQAAPMGSRTRVSSDHAWPLRRADGTRWCDPRKGREA